MSLEVSASTTKWSIRADSEMAGIHLLLYDIMMA